MDKLWMLGSMIVDKGWIFNNLDNFNALINKM